VNAALAIADGPPIEVDFLWRAQRLAVETDAFGTHGTRHSFERDRRRDQRLKLAGYDPLRFTRRQILNEPDSVVATLGALLALAGATEPR
jgi:very-short-patch-repair endonuclease